MNIQNLINLNDIANINHLTIEQLHNLLEQAYAALTSFETYTIEYLKLLSTIRRLELRLVEIKSQPRPTPSPRFTP